MERPHPVWRRLKIGWWCGAGLIAAAAPVIAADIFIMSPLAILFLISGSTIMRNAKQKPSCRLCQLELTIEEVPSGPIVRAVTKKPPAAF